MRETPRHAFHAAAQGANGWPEILSCGCADLLVCQCASIASSLAVNYQAIGKMLVMHYRIPPGGNAA
jgi:hypothetical protein